MTDKNIRVIFTPKADTAISEIKNQYNLQNITGTEKSFKLFAVVRSFAKEEISEKNLIDSLQKDLEISQQIAKQISKKIIENIIPFLVKVPEEKFKDLDSIEEISKKVFGEEKKSSTLPERTEQTKKEAEEKNTNTPLDIKPLKSTGGVKGITPPEKEKKPVPIIKKTIPQTKQSRGPDSYREPIE